MDVLAEPALFRELLADTLRDSLREFLLEPALREFLLEPPLKELLLEPMELRAEPELKDVRGDNEGLPRESRSYEETELVSNTKSF